MASYYSTELYYVKVRRIAGSQRVWCGWLSTNDNYASHINAEATLPPRDKVLPVQLVVETNEFNPADQDVIGGGEHGKLRMPPVPESKGSELPQGPLYLRAINYQGGGASFLGGSGDGGFYLYWWPVDKSGGPGDKGYLLKLVPLEGTNEYRVRRASDDGPVYTYHDYYMGYWKAKTGTEYEITFEFIPAADFSPTFENWMRDQHEYIGSRHLSEIAIPGSHDAGCNRLLPALLHDEIKTSQSQGLDIRDQLIHGSRYFDLRAWWDSALPKGSWRIYHGAGVFGDWSRVTLQDAVDQLDEFLSKHPNEIVLVSLLLEEEKGTVSDHCKKGWELMFSKLDRYNWGCQEKEGDTSRKFSEIKPDFLAERHKNLLIFSWGKVEGWRYTDQQTNQSIFVSPWSSIVDRVGRNDADRHMDLDGVWVDKWDGTAEEIKNEYLKYLNSNYDPELKRCWILHTNTPWQTDGWGDSLYAKHFRNTPDLAGDVEGYTIRPPKANIINIDYVGDAVPWKGGVANLVRDVIESNKH